jgi:hypothetical protein
MASSPFPAVPGGPRSAPAVAKRAPGCRVLVACYASFGAAWCAYMFFLSTQPVTIPDDWGAQAPAWLGVIATLAMFWYLPWLVYPVPLLIAGIVHLRRAAPGSWPWLAAWAGAVAADIALEALVATHVGFHFPSPTYTGPGMVSWVALGESSGFVAVGAAMIWIVDGAGARRGSRWAGGHGHGPKAR